MYESNEEKYSKEIHLFYVHPEINGIWVKFIIQISHLYLSTITILWKCTYFFSTFYETSDTNIST